MLSKAASSTLFLVFSTTWSESESRSPGPLANTLNRLIGLVGRVFSYGPGDLGSISGRVIRKTSKMVLDTSLLNAQQYNVRIKGIVEQSWERSSALPLHPGVVAIEKGAFWSPSTTVANFTWLFTFILYFRLIFSYRHTYTYAYRMRKQNMEWLFKDLKTFWNNKQKKKVINLNFPD